MIAEDEDVHAVEYSEKPPANHAVRWRGAKGPRRSRARHLHTMLALRPLGHRACAQHVRGMCAPACYAGRVWAIITCRPCAAPQAASGLGVPGGASTKMLATELKPGSVSLMVGVSGAAGERLAEVTASRRSLPLRASARAGGRLTKQIGI